MTTTYHLRISGGALSVMVITERCYGPCWLSDDNKGESARTAAAGFFTGQMLFFQRNQQNTGGIS